MAQAIASQYHGLPMTEVVPEAMEVKGISKSSVLTGRRRVRFQPQSGTRAAPGSIVQFVLADSSCLLDVNSMVFSYKAQALTTQAGATFAFDDGPSWCRRIQVSLNGQLLDDTDNAHRNANAQVYMDCDKSWYNGPGSFAGYYKYNNDLAATNANAYEPRYADVLAGLPNAVARVGGTNGANLKLPVALPAGLLSSALRGKQYWPLANMGEMVIQLTLAQPGEALIQTGATADANVSYELTDFFCEVDLISPHYMYQELLNRVTQMEGEAGLVIPVDTTIVAQGQSIPAGSSETSIVTSRATNNLRRVVVTNTPTSALANIAFPSVSTFPAENFDQVQFRCGSLYFPSQPANSLARAFWMTQAAFGKLSGGDRGGVANIVTYANTTNSANGNITNPITNVADLSGQYLQWADNFVLAYNFDSYQGGEQLDADGVSVLGQAGSQLVTILRNAPVEAITPTISLIATKYIQLKDGALKIQGV